MSVNLPPVPPNDSLFGRGLLGRPSFRIVPVVFHPDGEVNGTVLELRACRLSAWLEMRDMTERASREDNRCFTAAELCRWRVLVSAVQHFHDLISDMTGG